MWSTVPIRVQATVERFVVFEDTPNLRVVVARGVVRVLVRLDVPTDAFVRHLVAILQVVNKPDHLRFVGVDDQLGILRGIAERGQAPSEPALRCLVRHPGIHPHFNHRTLIGGGCGEHGTGEGAGWIFDMPAVEHVIFSRHHRMQDDVVLPEHGQEQFLLVIDAGQPVQLPHDQVSLRRPAQGFPNPFQVV